MPRYFFHVRDSVEMLDHEGTEFPDPAEASNEAVVTVGEMLRDLDGKFWNSPEWRLWVTDEAGDEICSLRIFAERA
jgi:hypothetical protein